MEGKLSKEQLDDIQKVTDPREKDIFLTDDEFDKLKDPLFDLEEYRNQTKGKDKLKDIYFNIIDILKKYCDLREDYYGIVSLWIIGTYFHENFPSYPYLFFNAMRGSGKTRLMKLVKYLSKEGSMLNSLTEAVLFRTTGTLCIDEFEGVGRKGMESLRELLNSAYKKGTTVKRMKKVFTKEGEDQQPVEFDVYRPICLANISGMESVLADRCITLILEKSNKTEITNLVELFEIDPLIQKTKELCNSTLVKKENLVQFVQVQFLYGIYTGWNDYISTNYTNYTNYTNNTNNTNYTNYTKITNNDKFPYKKLKDAGFNGRELELSFPLIIISDIVGEIKTTLLHLSQIMSERREEDVIENTDVALIDFVSQQVEDDNWKSVKELVRLFREHLQTSEEWINVHWMGKALKRLNLVISKRRQRYGMEVILNVSKAQEKIKMFK